MTPTEHSAHKNHYLADNFEQLKQTKKLRERQGTKYTGQYRYTIAKKLRAIFRIEETSIVILILQVDPRKNIYD
jgi:mRNA-degrading endonuclease RelE of RelBE toxin-antitoxin system